MTPLIFGALAEVLPDRVQADSGMLMLMNVQGRTREGQGVSSILFASGGSGAFKGIDGASCTPSPSNITGTPVEVWENLTGSVIEDKSFLVDSGGGPASSGVDLVSAFICVMTAATRCLSLASPPAPSSRQPA